MTILFPGFYSLGASSDDGGGSEGGGESTVDLTYPNGIWSPFYVVDRQKFDAWIENGSVDSEVINDMILCNCTEIDLQYVEDVGTLEGTFNGKKLIIGVETDTESEEGRSCVFGWYDIENPSGSSNANYYIKLSQLTGDSSVDAEAFDEVMNAYLAMTQSEPEPGPGPA